MLVMPTDSAVSPPDKYVMTLLDVPPGQVPTRTTPTSSSSLRPKILPRPKARSGMITNCATQPVITSRGCLKTTVKSESFIVRPMPNMTIIRR